MTVLQALLLGVVQGATEFLPISSSGHLVLVPWLLGWSFEPRAAFLFDVLVQWGTLVAVVAYFWTDLLGLARAALRDLLRGHPLASTRARLAWLLVLASIPGALAGLLLRARVEATFASPRTVGFFLLGTAALLAGSEWVGRRRRPMASLGWLDALIIGAAQALALFPGMSRSGATIAGGLSRDLERAEAARFSFLMSIPIMIGAGAVALIELFQAPNASAQIQPLLAGFLTAAAVGYLAIRWLLRFLAERPLTLFVIYCTAAGLGSIALSFVHG